ncbi:unnamed protein product [Discosporangium mesarthrocarpum]
MEASSACNTSAWVINMVTTDTTVLYYIVYDCADDPTDITTAPWHYYRNDNGSEVINSYFYDISIACPGGGDSQIAEVVGGVAGGIAFFTAVVLLAVLVRRRKSKGERLKGKALGGQAVVLSFQLRCTLHHWS